MPDGCCSGRLPRLPRSRRCHVSAIASGSLDLSPGLIWSAPRAMAQSSGSRGAPTFMKRLFHDVGVLAPFLAALCVLAGAAFLQHQDMRHLDEALVEQDRLMDVGTELQATRRALLESGGERSRQEALPRRKSVSRLRSRKIPASSALSRSRSMRSIWDGEANSGKHGELHFLSACAARGASRR